MTDTIDNLTTAISVESPVGDASPLMKEARQLEYTSPLDAASGGRPWGLTDWDMARRLAYYHGEKIRFDIRAGIWRTWNGRKWATDESASVVFQLAATVASGLLEEARACGDSAIAQKIAAHAIKSRNRYVLEAMVSLAAKQPGLTPSANEWDADAMALNTPTGILDLRTGKLSPHDPARLFTKITSAAYIEDVKGDRWKRQRDLWEACLARWQPDPEIRAFLQRAAGYSATGLGTEEVLFLLHGPTAAGKTSIAEAMKSALGDYASTADFESFLKRSFSGGARGDIARLAGSRLVTSSEVESGKELAEGLVKNLAGGEKVVARHLYRPEFEFVPTFKLWLIANEAPTIDAEDSAMWRRILRIPFEHTIPEAERDPAIKKRLIDPSDCGPVILSWIVQGALAWQSQGLQIPAVIRAATADLRADFDVTADFFETQCVFNRDMYASNADLRQRYEVWANEQGYRFKVSPRKFAQKLKSRGCVQERSSMRVWRGVCLR
jgi:putative DNA primase/helicase